MGTRTTASTNKDRVRSTSSQPLAAAAVSRRRPLESAATQRLALLRDREPSLSHHSHGDMASRSFASEPVSGFGPGRLVSHQGSAGVTAPHLSGGGISRMVTNGTLSRPTTGPGVSQVYAELGPWLYVLALLILIALLAFFYLSQTSHVAAQVSEMQALEEKVQQLKRKNSATRVKISAYEGIARIQREATAMGLAEPLEREYVVVWLDEPAAAPGAPAVPNGVTSMAGSTAAAAVSLPASGRSPAISGAGADILQQFQSWVQGGWAPAQSLVR